ncbi:protein ITPRID1 [Sarcophilus harrisii]|uniref:ITPR interacting domain containing 1 n=1 Tax=Sarcophilus harrisii TaxID=9305 RepID=A0A7N4PW70_SARHA|nr:protein ITPRID1 [Sarcophilus harrisii]
MAEESSGLGTSHSLEKKKILRSTKTAWLPLDEQQPLPPREGSGDSPIPELENSRQESIQQWLDSGFFLTTHENLQQAIDQTDSLNKQGVVSEAVKDYMRSLQQVSEAPALSRGTSFNSFPSVSSIPKSISEWLEFWQKDPVEILLDLGFGAEEPDICTKIPSRFLGGSSAAKGINIRVFLEAHKQRMDLEIPNLYGRFRQLEVLDHVTNAFSSLLNDVNSLQREGKEQRQPGPPEPSQVPEAKGRRRRIGQLLRKASKWTMKGDGPQRQAGFLGGEEDLPPAPGEPDQSPSLQDGRMDFAGGSHPRPSTEQRPPLASDKPVSHEALPSVPGKPRPSLWGMSPKQPPLPCAPEGSPRDRGIQEKGPLLSHRLRQVVHMDRKPPDSFEMEEVQSFEEEPGNLLEVTLGTVGAGVTRTSSCQSDSSGFLEEPSEPLPLQTSQGLSSGTQGAESPSLGSPQQHPQEPTEGAAQGMLSLPILNRGQSDREQEIFASVKEEDSRSAEQSSQEGPLKDTPTGEGLNLPPSSHSSCEVEGDAITSKCDYPGGFMVACVIDVQTDSPQAEEPEEVFMERSPSIMGDKGGSVRMDNCPSGSEVPGDGQAGQWDLDVSRLGSPLENGMLTAPRQGPATQSQVIPPSGGLNEVSETYESNSDVVSGCRRGSSPGLEASGKVSTRHPIPEAETNPGAFRSVTIQMSSKLVAGIHSTAAGEGPRENPGDPLLRPSEFSRSEAFLTAGPRRGARERQTKEASVQTVKRKPGSQSVGPASSCGSATRRQHHLTHSVSLDSGMLGSHQPASASKPAVPGLQCKHGEGCCCHCHCCCCCCCCCCRQHPRPWAWQPPGTASCSYCHLQAQLSRTVRILQEAVMRGISPSTVQDMEIWRTVCQSFREHSEEIGHHLMKQQAHAFSDMSEEGREEMRQLHTLRQDLHQQVAELEFQLSDRVRQIQEGMLLFDQLLEEQSQLCSELGLSDWGEGNEPTFHADSDIHKTVSPRAPSPVIKGQGSLLPEETRACALTCSSPESSPEMALQPPALAEQDPSAASWDQHVNSEEKTGSSQSRMDLKGFFGKLKKTFKSSFGNEPADGQN